MSSNSSSNPFSGIRRKQIIKYGVCVALLVLVLYLIRRPVFLRGPSFGSHRGEPGFVLFNPFRDKEPEKSADQFLTGLKAGKCSEVVINLPAERQQHICEKQEEYPLKSWELKNREDKTEKITLYYRHVSGNTNIPEHLWLDARLLAGKWEITDMGIVY